MPRTKTSTIAPARVRRSRAAPVQAEAAPPQIAPKATRAQTMMALMQAEGGATAQALAEAVGWQVHSVRGFIAGTLKKRPGAVVTTTRIDGKTRYSLTIPPRI